MRRSVFCGSNRQAERIIHEQVVVNAPALGELELIADPAEYVVIRADLMQLCIGSVKQDLQHHIVRACPNSSTPILAKYLQIADDVAQVTRREHGRLLERKSAVEHHAFRLTIDQTDRHPTVGL